MAGSRGLVWDGLQEYLEELRQLPEECKAEAMKLIDGGVNAAYLTVAQVYDAHRFTGTLRNRLRIKKHPSGAELVSGSPIAWLFDNGSQTRNWKTGSKKSTGRMGSKSPPTHIFARTVAKERRALAAQFTAMLLRRGAATVTGDE